MLQIERCETIEKTLEKIWYTATLDNAGSSTSVEKGSISPAIPSQVKHTDSQFSPYIYNFFSFWLSTLLKGFYLNQAKVPVVVVVVADINVVFVVVQPKLFVVRMKKGELVDLNLIGDSRLKAARPR